MSIMPMRWRLLAVGLLLLIGCGPKTLSKEEAERLLAKEVAGPASCAWRQPQKYTNSTWVFLSYDDQAVACGDALQKAGLVTVGKCADPASNGKCFKREISATGKNGSKIGEKDGGLEFTCGSIEVKRVVSVTNKDATAAARYSRLATLDADLMKLLEPCVLDRPEAGEKERERAFRRDDAGVWTMVAP